MNDPSSLAYQDMRGGADGPGPPPTAGSPNMAQYKFSPDEMRVLQECNRESFFQRSLPFGTAFGLATGAAVQQGYLKGNLRFGAFPKVTLAVAAGYFLGKLSYQQACAEKLMALPGSYIGQLLRDRRDGSLGRAPMGAGAAAGGGASMLGARADDIYSDAGPGSALDLDSERAGHVFSEDLTRPEPPPAGAGGAGGADGAGQPPPPLSYEELRRLNRGEHARAKQDPYRVAPPPPPRQPPPPYAAPRGTNAYGDVME